MKQLLDERMNAGSASNWLPPAMFFLQLNLSGVIILLSLMFYANALGESFVRGLVVVFLCVFLCCVMYVWVRIVVECVHDALCVCVCVRVIWVGVGGFSIWRCGGVRVCGIVF